DAIDVVSTGIRIGDDAERSRMARDEALDLLARRTEYGHDIESQPGQVAMMAGQLVDAEIAERTGRVAKETQQGSALAAADMHRMVVDVGHFQSWSLGRGIQAHVESSSIAADAVHVDELSAQPAGHAETDETRQAKGDGPGTRRVQAHRIDAQ